MVEGDRLAVQPGLALVRLILPGQDLDQRVFPAPFSPTSACVSPGRTEKLTLSTAVCPGKRFVTPWNSSTLSRSLCSVRAIPLS